MHFQNSLSKRRVILQEKVDFCVIFFQSILIDIELSKSLELVPRENARHHKIFLFANEEFPFTFFQPKTQSFDLICNFTPIFSQDNTHWIYISALTVLNLNSNYITFWRIYHS